MRRAAARLLLRYAARPPAPPAAEAGWPAAAASLDSGLARTPAARQPGQPAAPRCAGEEEQPQHPAWRRRAALPGAADAASWRGFGSSTAPPDHADGAGGGSSDAGGGAGGGEGATTLQASMDKLVDTAVALVEEGKLQQAVQVLQQGIELLTSAFPGSPELGELHNQAALLLLFGHQHDAAAQHASDALALTEKAFGPTHPLTGHRLLRLGSIRVAAGQMQEAQPLLAAAADMLSAQREDPSLSEALFYLHLLALAAADSPAAVAAVTPGLSDALKHLVATLGPESMIVRLALSAHSRLVGAALDGGLPQGEAAFKQHIALQEVQDPGGPELGLSLYQLATTYYAHDLLHDAGPALQRGAALLRGHYPPDHDLVILCKHRLGMIAAAGRDHRAATQLLGETRAHYAAQQPGHPLAHEAELGLAMARLKALDPRTPADARKAAVETGLAEMRAALAGMAGVLGTEHLLVSGGSRYLAQLGVMMGGAAPERPPARPAPPLPAQPHRRRHTVSLSLSAGHAAAMALPVTSVLWAAPGGAVNDRAVAPEDFAVSTTGTVSAAELADGEVLVELLYLSVDPYMRGRMRHMKSHYFVGPFEAGQPITSGALGLVKVSRAAGFAAGDVLTGMMPWSSAFVLRPDAQAMVSKLDPGLLGKVPLSYFLGVLGMPGMTAYCSLKKIAAPKAGEVAFVSGAAGAVGLVAGQLLKRLHGCTVIGSAGSDDKVALLRRLGFDHAFNYKTTDTSSALAAAAPDGIDIYFDNVGGKTLETVLDHARNHARIVACGMISQYDAPEEQRYGVRNLFQVITKRITMQGFIVSDWMAEMGPEFSETMGALVRDGRVVAVEHVTRGLPNAGRAFVEMMAGGNVGKAVVAVAEVDPFPVADGAAA
ncbi:hypothetical protein HT031_001440 [Scenedesmus sp. PABB004]|nr:hypothetical protein HT031_001440 [Scenedesmus sp. PABB004]